MIAIVFLVSAAETTGATTAVCKGTLDRDIKMEELQGSRGGWILQRDLRMLRMSSADFIQSKCRSGDNDRSDQPVYDPDGSVDPDPASLFRRWGAIFFNSLHSPYSADVPL